MFSGEPTSHRDRTATDERLTAAREDPLGPYHGIAVKYRRNAFVLSGPPSKFVSDEANEGAGDREKGGTQLSLFEQQW